MPPADYRSTVQLAAAHGIGAKVLETWSENVSRVPRVLVPVALDVLVVRQSGAPPADCRLAKPPPTPEGEEPPDAATLRAPPFALLDSPRPRGAHLHWALPDAITRLRDPGDGTVAAPPVPDRWLVVRLSGAGGLGKKRRHVAAWVLEAVDPTPRVTPLADWRERGVATGTATALGWGDPAWAAYYDNVARRLAFHDPLDGVTGPIAYAVCGWWSDPVRDPLGDPKIRSLAAYRRRLGELGWSVSGDLRAATRRAVEADDVAGKLGVRRGGKGKRPSKGRFVSPLALLHGSAVGIGWPQAGGTLAGDEVGGPPAPGEVAIALGATAAQAVGELVAHENGRRAEARLVEALHLGSLRDADRPDGRGRLDVRLHAAGFASLPGETSSERIVHQRPSEPRGGGATGGANSLSAIIGGSFDVDIGVDLGAAGVGKLDGALGWLRDQDADEPEATPAEEVVARSGPRRYRPMDPSLMLRGAGRSFKHGGDGRFTQDGSLACRLSGEAIHRLGVLLPDGSRGFVEGGELLVGWGGSGSVPPECDEIVRELVLLDPGSAPAAADAVLAGRAVPSSAERERQEQRVAVEQTAWWITRDPRADHAEIVERTDLEGTLPSPLAILPPSRPWLPRHVDWRLEVTPDARPESWRLGEIDLEPAEQGANADPITVEGRTLLTGGAALALASAARQALADAAAIGGSSQSGGSDPDAYPSVAARDAVTAAGRLQEKAVAGDPAAALDDIARALERMDLVGGTLDGLGQALRDAAGPVRAGSARLVALRLVDGFGQYLDLIETGNGDPVVHSELLVAEPVEAAPGNGTMVLAPRFVEPARLSLRFAAASGEGEAGATESPVCGYLLPNHLDRALELFDADGANLGMLRPDPVSGAVFNEPPGQPLVLGRRLGEALPDPTLAGLADGLLQTARADAAEARAAEQRGEEPGEPLFGALLRLLDSTLWSVDPFARAGDEHYSLLVGHPLAVVRASLRLEVEEATETVAPLRVPVRLGSLAHWEDGLLGYWAREDYLRFHAIGAAASNLARELAPGRGFLGPAGGLDETASSFADDLAGDSDPGATPVAHPVVDAAGVVWLHPGETLPLTLLVMPHTLVSATSGILPRKEIGMRREWTAAALGRMAPTFRFGPVLVDPTAVRLPVATEVAGSWTWTHRADVESWLDEPVRNSTQDALLPPDPVRSSEGWLRLDPPE